MKDVLLPIREAYYLKLTSIGLDVYEDGAVRAGAPLPYVIIGTQTANESSNKTDFGHNVTTLLDIVTKVAINQTGGSKQADLIAAQIFEIINSKIVFTINEDLQSVSVKLSSDTKINMSTPTDRVYRRLLRFEHIIRQLN